MSTLIATDLTAAEQIQRARSEVDAAQHDVDLAQRVYANGRTPATERDVELAMRALEAAHNRLGNAILRDVTPRLRR